MEILFVSSVQVQQCFVHPRCRRRRRRWRNERMMLMKSVAWWFCPSVIVPQSGVGVCLCFHHVRKRTLEFWLLKQLDILLFFFFFKLYVRPILCCDLEKIKLLLYTFLNRALVFFFFFLSPFVISEFVWDGPPLSVHFKLSWTNICLVSKLVESQSLLKSTFNESKCLEITGYWWKMPNRWFWSATREKSIWRKMGCKTCVWLKMVALWSGGKSFKNLIWEKYVTC